MTEVSRSEKLLSALTFTSAVLAGIWFRFAQLSLKPFHHDEGVNSFFLLALAKQGSSAYRYNPENYHGPTLYYFALTALRFFGESDFALRFWPCLFGVLTIAILWFWRDKLGSVGLPVAAFLIALSPGLVFFSRYFIHEMMFGWCSLAIVIGAWKYAESKNFRWMSLLAVATGILLATKETAIITLVVLIIALSCASLWDVTRSLLREHRFTPAALVTQLRREWGNVRPSLDHTLSALIIVVFIFVFFYSSAFTNWPGVVDAFKSILHWTKERSRTDHVHSKLYYLGILLKLEFPLLIGGILAGLVILWRGTRFWLFAGAWTFGIVTAYSIIPYKTPWLMVSFLVPLAVVSGYAAEQLYRIVAAQAWRILWLGVLFLGLIFSWRLAGVVNFEKYDDNSNSAGYFTRLGERFQLTPYVDGQYGYVYAQTDRDFLELVKILKETADQFPTQRETGIYLASPEYWPLPWYLRNYNGVAYTGVLPNTLDESGVAQPILIARSDQQGKLESAKEWRQVGREYTLRPGVGLLIYVREKP
jgi:uncharacterized protein (TIGR03663 family)